MKLLLVILFLVNVNLLGSKIDNKVYDKKSNQYYKQYKKEFDRLPLKNKKKILEAYYTNEAYDLGFTMAGTMFLENRGKDTSYSNKNGRNKNIHKNGMITYDCGDYGINTMTYLKSIGKATKNHKKHIEACKVLSKDKLLNLTLALDHYKYGLEISNGNIRKSWNIYNTGNKKIINDRIYQMKGIIMVLEQEVKNNKLLDYKVALNDKK